MKKVLAMAVAAGLSVPAYVSAAEMSVDVYGKVHLSADVFSDAQVNDSTEEDSGYGFSSNSSRLGFKGDMEVMDGTKFIWQYESQVNIDDGTGDLAKRNTYGGFKGGWGKLIVGNHDTPFKRVLTKWDPFNETVGEGRSVFGEDGAGYGVGSKAKDYNQRAQNYVQYTSPDFGGANLIIGHSSDAENADSKGDNNENSLTSVGVEYAGGDWEVKVAYETESSEALDDDSTGFRGSVAWEPSRFAVGVFGESLDDATLGERTGYGLFGGIKVGGAGKVMAAYYYVDEWDEVTDSDGSIVNVGYFHKLNKKTKLYAMYAAADNSDAANYRMGDRGHGDELRPVEDGGDPSAFSLGVVYKF